MALAVGIVGLPNSGKSTLFNALLGRQMAEVAEYPFTTIEPHEGIGAVPDGKLEGLEGLEGIKGEKKIIPATVKFIDIAGLVKDAHKGEGLGNQFLAKIREVEAVCHVVRAFENPNVAHYYGSLDSARDIEIVNLELELGGISKPSLYVINVSEAEVRSKKWKAGIKIGGKKIEVIPICAKLEMELGELSEKEQKEYLKELGAKETGLDKLIKEAYQLLDLITFYTIKGGKEIRAWSLKRDLTALDAAGKVHTDMAKGFIKAEVIDVDKLIKIGSWKKAGELGKIRTEGRDYKIKDREVVEFKFSV